MVEAKMKFLILTLIALMTVTSAMADETNICNYNPAQAVAYCYNACPNDAGVADSCVKDCFLSYINQCDQQCQNLCEVYSDYICKYSQEQEGDCGYLAYEYCTEALQCNEPENEVPEFSAIAS